MTDNTLDKIFPVPELSDLKEEKVQELQEAGFTITNFNSGGIFNMLLMIILELRIEFTKLLRTVLKQMYVSSATGVWLQEKGADYSKAIKEAQKTRGKITVTASGEHETITIPQGTVFKTEKDINGTELRYFSIANDVLLKTEQSILVEVEAEKAGAEYNVPAGKIVKTLTHLDGVESVSNLNEWITQAGADQESEEIYRSRILNAWSELATGTTAAKYKSVAEKVNGVLYATVDQLHPRGQGTVDIIVTSTAGAASPELIGQVEQAIEEVRGEYDNVLVKSAETVYQDLQVVVIMPKLGETNGVKERCEASIQGYFKISTERDLNELILLDILYSIKKDIPESKNIRILEPAEDVMLETGKVIVLGNLTITVEQEA